MGGIIRDDSTAKEEKSTERQGKSGAAALPLQLFTKRLLLRGSARLENAARKKAKPPAL
jgi:hypothetical protein